MKTRRIRVHLGTLRNSVRREAQTERANFLRILEAPPGFEPGMEVLQISQGLFILLTRLALWSRVLPGFDSVWALIALSLARSSRALFAGGGMISALELTQFSEGAAGCHSSDSVHSTA
jgi:hypothetical protein